MVAPISVTMPSSMAGSRASCCALLKRWISSMKRIVRAALRARASRAPLIAARTSAVPELTAESCTRRAPVSAAMRRASVVLPLPGRAEEDHAEELRRPRRRRAARCRARRCAPARRTPRAHAAACAPPEAPRPPPARRSSRRGPRAQCTPGSSPLTGERLSATIGADAQGAGPEHHLRAAQRVFGAASRRAPAQGQGRGARAIRRRSAQRTRRLRGPARHPPRTRTSASLAAPPPRASRGAPSSPATGTAASTAAAPATSPSTTWCRAPREAPTRGTTWSRRARPATARRATGRRTSRGCG